MNFVLKAAIVCAGTTHKAIAREMHINTRVFGNKLNHRKQPNGNEARFSEAEKAWLAARLDISKDEIF